MPSEFDISALGIEAKSDISCIQNLLHIYAKQDLRAPHAVREPRELNNTSRKTKIKLFDAKCLFKLRPSHKKVCGYEPHGGGTCLGKSMSIFNWTGHSQTAWEMLEIKAMIYSGQFKAIKTFVRS